MITIEPVALSLCPVINSSISVLCLTSRGTCGALVESLPYDRGMVGSNPALSAT